MHSIRDILDDSDSDKVVLSRADELDSMSLMKPTTQQNFLVFYKFKYIYIYIYVYTYIYLYAYMLGISIVMGVFKSSKE